jgi:hypothetical protein
VIGSQRSIADPRCDEFDASTPTFISDARMHNRVLALQDSRLTANSDQAATFGLPQPETIHRFSEGRNASTTNINAGEARRLAS